jgi:2-methylene-furan-3-one reductase
VGTIAIQLAKHVFKASKVATTASSKKIDKLKQLGADEVVDYNRETFERELAEYDFALDCTAEVSALLS